MKINAGCGIRNTFTIHVDNVETGEHREYKAHNIISVSYTHLLPAIWDTERKVDELSPAQDVALFRTNDYRTGFLAERSGEIHWAITSRNWAVMALEPHTITAGIDVTVDLIPITYADIYHEHTITAGITVAVQMLYGASYNAFTEAHNEGNLIVVATCLHFMTD